MILTRRMAKIKAEGSADSGSKTSPPDTVTSTVNTAIYRDVAGAVAEGRDPSGIKDMKACVAPNQNDPTEDSNHCSVTETTKARRGRTAVRRGKKAIAKESGLKTASVVESATAPDFPSPRQGQKRQKEEDKGNKENESMSGQHLPSTNARRIRRRTARAVSDEAAATPQNTNSSVVVKDLSGSRSLRRVSARTEYSSDEVVATAALLQSASGKLNRSASMLLTSSEVERNSVLLSEATLSLCSSHESEQILKRIGIPGIEAVMTLVGA
ncbi:hypothetical protein ACEPAF_1735 [Sanghuangporus sanghuang]